MVQAVERPFTFDEFVEWYPDDGRLYTENRRILERLERHIDDGHGG